MCNRQQDTRAPWPSGQARMAARWWVVFAILIMSAAHLAAFPEYQAFIKEHSGQPVNCAFCHTHSDGPDGMDRGQLGRLTPDELARVNQSRGALAPGPVIDNPILNDFGDQMVAAVGMQNVLDFKQTPAGLAAALGKHSDLDGDGIPDAREYLDGTNPLDRFHGQPGRLFVNNLWRYKERLVLASLLVGLLLFGLVNLLRGASLTKPTE
ncbi:MAG: thrombospondin type 3 repeat-containing protein [Armatimonadota bacterium]